MTIKVHISNEGSGTQIVKVVHINPYTQELNDINSNKLLTAGESGVFYVHTGQSLVVSETSS